MAERTLEEITKKNLKDMPKKFPDNKLFKKKKETDDFLKAITKELQN